MDRKDSNKPYTYNNTVACCKMCNYMKGVFGKDDFIKQCKIIINFQKTKENI
jgi:hypothetical protein